MESGTQEDVRWIADKSVRLPWLIDEMETSRRISREDILDYSIEGNRPTVGVFVQYMESRPVFC